jgi:murein DD-endopeptidase MepM/ murein hydrolase activator NlpD
MSHSTNDPTQHAIGEASISRRRVLGALGAACGLGVFALVRDSVAAQTRASEFNNPGEALEPAVRIPPPTTTIPTVDTTDTTDTTSTVPEIPDGQIMFPIVVGVDDFCFVSDSFGECRGSGCSRSHEGVDIMADLGLPVRAPVAGRLTKRYVDSGAQTGAGNGWTLQDDDGDVIYRFFHLDRHEDGLDVDDDVEAGQIIGYVGNTGTSGITSGTNHHLHFEYRPNNVATDSFDLLVREPTVSFEGE